MIAIPPERRSTSIFFLLGIVFFPGTPLADAAAETAADTAAPLPADTSITLERTICYGTCPSYRVEVHADGTVVFLGRQFVGSAGEQRASVPVEVVRKLVRMFDHAGYFSWPEGFENQCESTRTDHPAAIVTYSSSGHTRTVTDYLGCESQNSPLRRLRELEREVDSTLNTAQWIAPRAPAR